MSTRPSSKASSIASSVTAGLVRQPMRDEPYTPPTQQLHKGETKEVQNKRCTVPDYAELPMCRSCKSGVQGEHCRFRKARLVARSADGTARVLGSFASGSGFALSTHDCADGVTAAERKVKQHILGHVCNALSPLLEEEHAGRQHEAIAIVTHKGYLRELERGPLCVPQATEFGNGEVRVYAVTIYQEGDGQRRVMTKRLHPRES